MTHGWGPRYPIPTRIAVAFAAACPLFAQEYSHLSGSILDPSGAAVTGASVTAVSQESGFRRATLSSNDGTYLISYLQPGVYKISVGHEGFRTAVRAGVPLEPGHRTQADFALQIGGVHETLDVTGSPPQLATDEAAVGAVISRNFIEKLPLNGRGLLGLLELAPGTVTTPATRGEAGQFSSSGQRPNMNYFTVDGVSANTGVSGGGIRAQSTGGSLPGMTALGSFHGLISVEELDEFRIQSSTASADFGRLPGAQVSLASRSGANDFHGSLFYYLRDRRPDANDWFANRAGISGSPWMRDFGASAGGRIVRDRTFFFTSYEALRLREPFAWQSASPTVEARRAAPEWMRPVLDLFPLPNGERFAPGSGLAQWRGQYDRRSNLGAGSLRIDQYISSRVTLFARANVARSSNDFTTTQVNDLAVRSSSFTAGASVVAASSAMIDFRFNRSVARGLSAWHLDGARIPGQCDPIPILSPGSPTVCESLFRFSVAGVGQAVLGAEGDQRQSQWHFTPSALIAAGGHQLRLGFDHWRYRPERDDHAGSLSLIAERFNDLLQPRPQLWVGTAQRRQVRGELAEYSLHAHDTWRLHPRLTLSLGLRWEYARSPHIPTLSGPLLSDEAYSFPNQSSIWRKNRGYLAPRGGISWRLLRRGGPVLRAGWGLYYDSSLSIATDLINGGPLSVTRFLNNRNAPFSTLLSFGFAPELQLPAIRQWSFTAEQTLPGGDVVSASYVGSSAYRLLRREYGAFANSQTLWLALATNNGSSEYHGLQLQYRRPLRRGVQAQASYMWSHSIDDSSSDSVLHWVGAGVSAASDRGNSDFDVRHAFNAAVTLDTGRRASRGLLARLASDWGLDNVFRARSGFPINPLLSEYALGIGFGNAFRPDLITSQPLWRSDVNAPGHRALNSAAFRARAGEGQGSLGRNSIAGFGMYQIDLSARRSFGLGEGRTLAFRAEVFNLLNHPNFADPQQFLSSPLFGQSPSMLNRMLGTGSPGSGLTPMLQSGGARSIQFVLRLRF